MTTYTKDYDTYYTNIVNGYFYEKEDGTKGYIEKDARTTWSGNNITDGWRVYDEAGKSLFYAGTLKEAKEYIEK